MSKRPDQRAIRREILDRLRPLTSAWSVDGRRVIFMCGFDLGVQVGGFLTVTPPSGPPLLVQVHGVTLAEREGVRFDVTADALASTGDGIQTATLTMPVRAVDGDGAVLGALTGATLGRAPGEPFGEAELRLATAAEIALVMPEPGPGLDVGVLTGAGVDARLRAAGFGRHTFLCGQSGSGKTYSMGVLLERLLLGTELPIVVVDPNSDYVRLTEMVSRDDVNRARTRPLGRGEYADLRRRYRALDIGVARTADSSLGLRIHLSDLAVADQATVLGLDPVDDAEEYTAYADAAASLEAPYGVADVEAGLHRRLDEAGRRVILRIANLGIAGWTVWADPADESLATTGGGHRALVLDIGGLSNERERSVVLLALLTMLRRRPQRSPVAVVIDEAHNVCPPDAATPLQRALVEHLIWIAGEGRKFGIYLLLATQRPQKVHRNVISQCDNLLLMRVNSSSDLAEIAEIFSHVPAAMVAEARSFGLGEALAAGPVAPTPMRLRVGERWTAEGGGDLPATWARR